MANNDEDEYTLEDAYADFQEYIAEEYVEYDEMEIEVYNKLLETSDNFKEELRKLDRAELERIIGKLEWHIRGFNEHGEADQIPLENAVRAVQRFVQEVYNEKQAGGRRRRRSTRGRKRSGRKHSGRKHRTRRSTHK
jgi:hypothetical protein